MFLRGPRPHARALAALRITIQLRLQIMVKGPTAGAPAYEKPSQPGIAMNFDNSVSLYHVIGPDDSFEKAAIDLFALC
jgi:hypothetical protein